MYEADWVELDRDRWSRDAGYRWERHAHSVRSLIRCDRGSMTLHFDRGDETLEVGEHTFAEIGEFHSATVGIGGVECTEVRYVPAPR